MRNAANSYTPRLVDGEIAELFADGIAAIAVDGPKGVGKTATARRCANHVYHLDDLNDLRRVQANPDMLVSHGGTTLIDEWQRFPASWDIVRRAVDTNDTGMRFLLTGSASNQDGSVHSGAGRIVRTRMRPLSLVERGLPATVSLAQLLTDSPIAIEGSTPVVYDDYVEHIVRGGFPGMRHLGLRGIRAQLDGYIDRVIDRDIPEAGVMVRNTGSLRRWFAAYAAATGTEARYERIRDAATAGEGDKTAKTTALAYRNALEQIWVLDPVPAWTPSFNWLRRLAASPKHYLVDPALAARILGLDIEALLRGDSPVVDVVPRNDTFTGALFENLIALNLRVYAQANEAHVYHLRTSDAKREIDFIVERGDGRIVAIEVKLTANPDERDFAHLQWLRNHIGDRLLDAVMVTTGKNAYRRQDGIAVVPAALLGP